MNISAPFIRRPVGTTLITVAIGEALHVHTLAIFVAEMLDHLHRAVCARVMLDEATDEPDDHGWRCCSNL